MLITSLILFIMSNSLSIRRDISIYYSRIGIPLIIFSIIICYNNMYFEYLNTILGLFTGLFNISSISLSFGLIILILTLIILNLTGFYPRIVINSKNNL